VSSQRVADSSAAIRFATMFLITHRSHNSVKPRAAVPLTKTSSLPYDGEAMYFSVI